MLSNIVGQPHRVRLIVHVMTSTISCVTTSINESNEQNDNKLFPNNKQLIKIVDLLGRDSEGLIKQPLFYIYNDGTVEKKIILE